MVCYFLGGFLVLIGREFGVPVIEESSGGHLIFAAVFSGGYVSYATGETIVGLQ